MEGQGFRDRIQEFTAKNAVVLGASFDPPAANRAFREKFGYPFDLLSDQERKVALVYGAAEKADARTASRISYLIDTQGKIQKVYGAVKPAEHPAQVLKDLG